MSDEITALLCVSLFLLSRVLLEIQCPDVDGSNFFGYYWFA